MENSVSEPNKESKAGVRKSLWWPRVTGIVLAVVTLILSGFLLLPILYQYGLYERFLEQGRRSYAPQDRTVCTTPF